MDGRVVLVSGATSGIGLAAATAFAGLGARVHLLARDAERGERARAESGAARVWDCDVSSLRSVRDFARRFRDEQGEVHALVNNAGVLRPSARCRWTGTSSPLHQRARPVPAHRPARAGTRDRSRHHDRQRLLRRHVHGTACRRATSSRSGTATTAATVYARHKRAQVVPARCGPSASATRACTCTRCTPGGWNTPGLSHSLPRFYKLMKPVLRSPDEGADTIVWLVAAGCRAAASGTTARSGPLISCRALVRARASAPGSVPSA